MTHITLRHLGAAGALVAMFLVVGVVGGSARTTDETPRVAKTPRVANMLVFTRADGSRVRFPGPVRAWCGRWSEVLAQRTLHVVVGERTRGQPRWDLDVVLGRRPRIVVMLPERSGPRRPPRVLLFVHDPPNELSSAEEETRGRIVVRSVRCRPRPQLALTIRATLGSEFFDGRPVYLRGSFAAVAPR